MVYNSFNLNGYYRYTLKPFENSLQRYIFFRKMWTAEDEEFINDLLRSEGEEEEGTEEETVQKESGKEENRAKLQDPNNRVK